MSKLKKKAQAVTFYDISAWLILLLGMTIWIIILRNENIETGTKVEQHLSTLNNDETFINILRTDNSLVSDMIIAADSTGSTQELEEYIDELLAKLYQKKVCWELRTEHISIDTDCKASGGTLLDSEIYLPSTKASLKIKGYST